MSDVTRLLKSIDRGERRAAAELLPLVYQELRRLARARMAQERSEHTLQATALVHEAYLRLVQDDKTHWQNSRHFFAAAGLAMRRILVEHARRKSALKHGGERERVPLDDDLPDICLPVDGIDVLSLNEALDKLAAEDPDMAELVHLSFFAGLSLEEAAEAMGTSRATAYRRWEFARAWLHDAMTGEDKS